MLVDCVDGGASVGFMLPFDLERAQAFWAGVLRRGVGETGRTGGRGSQGRHRRDGSGGADGTENQPHRGEISRCWCIAGHDVAA